MPRYAPGRRPAGSQRHGTRPRPPGGGSAAVPPGRLRLPAGLPVCPRAVTAPVRGLRCGTPPRAPSRRDCPGPDRMRAPRGAAAPPARRRARRCRRRQRACRPARHRHGPCRRRPGSSLRPRTPPSRAGRRPQSPRRVGGRRGTRPRERAPPSTRRPRADASAARRRTI